MGLFSKSKEQRDKEREQKETQKKIQEMKDQANASLQKTQWEAYQARKRKEAEEEQENMRNNLAEVQEIEDERLRWEIYKIKQSNPGLYELSQRPEMAELKSKFEATRILRFISVDETNRIILIQPNPYVHLYLRYDEIRSYELIENNNQVTKGGLGAAVAGGILFGAAGAMAGSVIGKNAATMVENLDLLINITDIDYPCVYLHYLNSPTQVSSQAYKNAFQEAKKAISCLDLLLEDTYGEPERNEAKGPSNTMNPYEEIKQLKELLDMGAITQDDYDAKKKQLLGI